MDTERKKSNMPQTMRNVFGIVMILIYLGMGALFLFGFFDANFSPSWAWLRWAGGALFIAYGVWRAFRQFKGIDPDITSR
ncbi:MAG: hypothetical protein K2M94_08930 [Paramuribaculum sp.]|nr:hypothetical protein [Paramuribaculum sp.]